MKFEQFKKNVFSPKIFILLFFVLLASIIASDYTAYYFQEVYLLEGGKQIAYNLNIYSLVVSILLLAYSILFLVNNEKLRWLKICFILLSFLIVAFEFIVLGLRISVPHWFSSMG